EDKRQIRNIGYIPYGSLYMYAFRNYFSHGSPIFRQPEPEAFIIPNTASSTYNPGVSCDCSKSLSNMKSQIEEADEQLPNLYQEYEMVKASLDQGKTSELISDIQSNMSTGKLKNKLLASFPLSDTVLIATLTRANSLPAGHLKQITIGNSPVSDQVMYFLKPVSEILPQGIAKQIFDAQTDYTSHRTLSGIQSEINILTNRRLSPLRKVVFFQQQRFHKQAGKEIMSENMVVSR
ncbi:hypothetical protein KKG82_05220, partial [Patescibacteria group bacterium]|nr:hypothetical protein [Patescibacteria group bacterium]